MSTLDHVCSPCETCGTCVCGQQHTVIIFANIKVCECGYCPTCRRVRGSPHYVHFVHDCPATRAK